MLEGLAAWVLRTYVGEYVENLNTDQLSIGYGGIELENLTLKQSALRGLELPLKVKSGFIGKLKLEIPFRNPKSQPWIICIDKLYIVAGPNNDVYGNFEEKEQQRQLYKLQQLEANEKQWRASRDNPSGSWWSESWWPSLYSSFSTTVVENLQLVISDVCFRYESYCPRLKKPFAFGITIRKLSAQSTDESWDPKFLHDDDELKFKVVELDGLAIYWDNDVELIGNLRSKDLADGLKRRHHGTDGDSKFQKEHEFILEPVTGKARIKKNSRSVPLSSKDGPRFFVELLLEKIPLSLSDIQYAGIIDLTETFQSYFIAQKYIKWRPQTTVRQSPIDWWRFAINCHMHQIQERNERNSKKFIMQRVTDIILYAKVYKEHLTNPAAGVEIKEVKRAIEEKMTFEELKVLRSYVTAKIAYDDSIKKAMNTGSQGQDSTAASSWGGWLTGWAWSGHSTTDASSKSSGLQLPPEVTFEEPVTKEEEEFLDELAEAGHNDSLFKRDHVFVQLQFKLSGGSFQLKSQSTDNQPMATTSAIAELEFSNVSWKSEIKPKSGTWEFRVTLGALHLRDLHNRKSIFPVLIQPQEKKSGESSRDKARNLLPYAHSSADPDLQPDAESPLLEVSYEQRPLGSRSLHKLCVSMQSLNVVYNPHLMKKLNNFSPSAKSKYKLRMSAVDTQLQKMALARYEEFKSLTKGEFIRAVDDLMSGESKTEGDRWDIQLNLSAPRIIVPEGFQTKETAMVIFDLGKISFMNAPAIERQKKISECERTFDEDSDEFITPRSTPPSESELEETIPTVDFTKQAELVENLKQKFYQKYHLSLSDLQVIVCKVKENWSTYQRRGTSHLHLVDRFSISLEMERRLVFSADPKWPGVTLSGSLPSLMVHVDENKVQVLYRCLNQAQLYGQVEKNTSQGGIYSPELSSKGSDSFGSNSHQESAAELHYSKPSEPAIDQASNILSPRKDLSTLQNRAKELLIESRLILTQFKFDEISLSLHSRGRCVAELRVSGVEAEYTKRPYDFSVSFTLHSLLLVDAIQTYGPEYELLIASHPDVQVISMQQGQHENKTRDDYEQEALIQIHYQQVDRDCPSLANTGQQLLRVASVQFNSLDIIANQETVVELMNVIRHAIPKTHMTSEGEGNEARGGPPLLKQTSVSSTGNASTYNEQHENQEKIQIDAVFQRANLILVRGVSDGHNSRIGRKVAAITAVDLEFSASFNDEHSIKGSLGGLRVMDLTPDAYLHRCVVSLGECRSINVQSMVEGMDDQKAFWFSYAKPTSKVALRDGKGNETKIDIHLASTYYMHSGQFLAELNLCMGDFKEYAKSMAKSLQTAATDMAIELVKRKRTLVDEMPTYRLKAQSIAASDTLDFMMDDIDDEPARTPIDSSQIFIKVCVESPVVVLPKVHNSTDLLVANLGHITFKNDHLSIPTKDVTEDATENEIDRLFINVSDMSLYSCIIPEEACEDLMSNSKTTFDYVDQANRESISLELSGDNGPRTFNPLYLVHDTGIKLTIDKCSSRSATDGLALTENGKDPSLVVSGEITTPFKVTLKSQTYRQLLETLDSLPLKYDKIPRQIKPEATPQEIHKSGSSSALQTLSQRVIAFSPRRSKSYHGNLSTAEWQDSDRSFQNSSFMSTDENKSFSFTIDKDNASQPTTLMTASFKVAKVQIELSGELSGKEHEFIDVTLEGFSLSYNNLLGSVTEMSISLDGLIVEDLLHGGEDNFKYLVSSRAHRPAPTHHAPVGVRLSLSCPENSSYMPFEALSTSLPSILHHSPGKNFPKPFSPFRPMLASKKFPSQPVFPEGYQESSKESLAGGVDDMEDKKDESLVKVRITTVDPNSTEFLNDQAQVHRTVDVMFNTLDVTVNLQTWVVVLEFFGMGAPQQQLSPPPVAERLNDSFASDPNDFEGEFITVDADSSRSTSMNTNLNLSMQSLSLTMNKENYCLAKAQVSQLVCHVGLRGPNQDISGSLGELKLLDMSPKGSLYKERFITLGNKALEFKIFRFGEPDPLLTRDYDMRLDLQMSSVQYVHTQRFISELIAFCQHFLQLQEVLGRMRAASEGNEVFAIVGRGARVSLSIEADTPILILPRSSSSEELVVAYLGQMTVVNSFLPASSPNTVASTLTASRKRHQEEESDGKTGIHLNRLGSKGSGRLLDCINIGLADMEVFTARRFSEGAGSRTSFGHERQGGPLMRETCRLELTVERNLESAFGKEVPDMIIAGKLSSVYITLDLSQFGLIMGMLGENLGEQLEMFERPSTHLIDPLAQIPESEEVWTTLSLSLELVNVSVEMIPRFTFGEIKSRPDSLSDLARFDLVKSKLVFESFSDGSRTIDLVSHDVLLHDIIAKDSSTTESQNVFTRVLQPSEKGDESRNRNYLQFEVHYLDTRDKTLVTCLFNKSQIVLIMDFLMETWNFITRKEESSYWEKQRGASPQEAQKKARTPSPTKGMMSKSVVTKGMSGGAVPKVSKTFELKINITDTQLIVVEDCSLIDTRAVILKTTAVLAWRPQHPSERPLSCSLQSLEVFSCTLANIEQTALSIIDPVIVLVELNAAPNVHSRGSVGLLEAVQSLPFLEVNFQSAFNIRLSYHDVKLFLRITESVKKQIARVVDGQKTVEREIAEAPSPLPTISSNKYSSQSVTKLKELGFSKTESLAALEKSGGQLNDAALLLTASTESEVQASTKSTSNEGNAYIAGFKVHAGTISVCVIDDCGNSDIPLTEFIMNGLLLWHDLQHTGDGSAHCTLVGEYYNRLVSRWEPFIEPWKFYLHWQRSLSADKTQSKLLMKVDAPERLDFNLTSAFVSMLQVTTASWTEDYYNNDNETVVNSNGKERPVKKRAPFVPFLMRNKTGCKLWFGTVTTTPSKAVSYGEGARLRSVSSNTTQVTSWREVEAGDEIPFSFESKDKLRHKATHEFKLHQVVVQVEGWQQMPPVSVDQVGEYFRHSPPVAEKSGPLQSFNGQQVRVVFAVSLEGARKVVGVRSSLVIVNKLNTGISIWAESYAEGSGETLPVLNPDESCAIPLPFVTWGLYVKPEISNDFDYCKEKLQWKEVAKPFEERGYSGECVNGRTKEVFRFCYSTYRQGFPEDQPVCLADAVNKKIFSHPGHIIKVTHHLILVNLLPVELTFTLQTESRHQRIKPGKSVPLHSVDAKQPFKIAFTFESYTEINFHGISAKYRSDDIIFPVTCHDAKGRPLVLNVKIEHDVLAAKISVFVPYWLVNKTGLPLVFRREGEAEECAGQFDEHEKARSLTPLLFSYIEEESSYRCQMRVGNDYYPDNNTNTLPVWSTPFSLEIERQHTTLYVKQGRNRPEKAYDIGVDVNHGSGPFSSTKIISLVTRFQLENRSQHCLAFAQRHLVRGQTTKITDGTLISPSGAITLFHWTRSDLDQLLCVRLENVEHCRWSGGFKIDNEDSFHVNMRSLLPGVCLFVRVEVVLRGATFHVVFTDAHQLPAPYRIDNMSEVEICFWQENCVDMSLRTIIKPKQSVPYALDELTLKPKITVSVFDEMSETYDMTQKQDYPMLYYQNPIYIAFAHTFRRAEHTGTHCQHDDSLAIAESVRDKQLVLDVDEKHRVFIGPKIPHRRSQLWRMTLSGTLKHVGSSSPFDPRKRSSNTEKSGYVLDVDLNHKGEYARLFLNQQDSKRNRTQTWSFEGGKLTCCHLGSIIQPLHGLEGLVEGGVPVLETGNILTYHGPPIWHCVSSQKLRPGCGVLLVKVVTDGPTRVLRITDHRYQNSDEDWMVVEPRKDTLKPTKVGSEDEGEHGIELNISLAGGIGLSMVNHIPEEIIFLTLSQIEVECLVDEKNQSLEVSVGNIQIDNQLFGSQFPVVLYPTPQPNKTDTHRTDQAMQISIQREKSTEYDLEIFRRFVVSIRRLTVVLEDRTMLKLLQFFGYGKEEADDFSDDDFNIYDSQRSLEKKDGTSKRLYFERLMLGEAEFRLSFAAVGRLTPDLQKIKKSFSVPIVSLEDAVIEFGTFKRFHLFESSSNILQQLGRYYKDALKGQAAIVLASLDIFGNPMGLLHDVSSGFEGLVKRGNLGGLIVNVAHGLSDATAKVTGSIADVLWVASMDSKFQETREAIRAERTGSSGDHLTAGLKGLGMGLFGGLTSLVTQPIEGASRKGIPGFLAGLGKGFLGTVTKPTAGVLDFASGTAAAVRGSARARPNAPKPVRLKRNCYDAGGVLPRYSKSMAEGQDVLLKLNDGNIDERFISSEVIRNDAKDGLRAVISTEGVYFVKTKKPLSPELVVLHVEFGELFDSRHLHEDNQHYLELIKRRENTGEVAPSRNPDKRPRVRCESQEIVRKVARKVNYMRSLHDERQFVVVPHEAANS